MESGLFVRPSEFRSKSRLQENDHRPAKPSVAACTLGRQGRIGLDCIAERYTIEYRGGTWNAKRSVIEESRQGRGSQPARSSPGSPEQELPVEGGGPAADQRERLRPDGDRRPGAAGDSRRSPAVNRPHPGRATGLLERAERDSHLDRRAKAAECGHAGAVVTDVPFPDGFRLERLRREHPRRGFRCGEEKVDDWLATKALQNQEKHLSVTKVLFDQAGTIAGYYTLATGQVDFGELPAEVTKRLPRRIRQFRDRLHIRRFRALHLL